MRSIAALLFCCIIVLAAPSHAEDKAETQAATPDVFSQLVTPATKGDGEIAIVSHSPPLTHSCSGSCAGVQVGSWTCAGPGFCALDCTASPPRTYCEKR